MSIVDAIECASEGHVLPRIEGGTFRSAGKTVAHCSRCGAEHVTKTVLIDGGQADGLLLVQTEWTERR